MLEGDRPSRSGPSSIIRDPAGEAQTAARANRDTETSLYEKCLVSVPEGRESVPSGRTETACLAVSRDMSRFIGWRASRASPSRRPWRRD
jgi:hypothetical protein